MCCCTAASYVISTRLVPIYESTATIDIDRQMPSGIIGQEATTNGDQRFRSVSGYPGEADSIGFGPASGGPAIEAHRFGVRPAGKCERERQLPGPCDEAPVRLANLRVTRPPNTYLLLISYRSPDPRLAADVANGIARSYLEHTYNIRF